MDDATTRLVLALLVEIGDGVDRIEVGLDGIGRTLDRIEESFAMTARLPRFALPAAGEDLR